LALIVAGPSFGIRCADARSADVTEEIPVKARAPRLPKDDTAPAGARPAYNAWKISDVSDGTGSGNLIRTLGFGKGTYDDSTTIINEEFKYTFDPTKVKSRDLESVGDTDDGAEILVIREGAAPEEVREQYYYLRDPRNPYKFTVRQFETFPKEQAPEEIVAEHPDRPDGGNDKTLPPLAEQIQLLRQKATQGITPMPAFDPQASEYPEGPANTGSPGTSAGIREKNTDEPAAVGTGRPPPKLGEVGAGKGVDTGVAKGMSTLPPKLPQKVVEPPKPLPAPPVQRGKIADQPSVDPGSSIRMYTDSIPNTLTTRLDLVAERMLMKLRIDDTNAELRLLKAGDAQRKEYEQRVMSYTKRMNECDMKIAQADTQIQTGLQALDGSIEAFERNKGGLQQGTAIGNAVNEYFANLTKTVDSYKEQIRTMDKANAFVSTHKRGDYTYGTDGFNTWNWATSIMTPFGVSPGNSASNFYKDVLKGREEAGVYSTKANTAVPAGHDTEFARELNNVLAADTGHECLVGTAHPSQAKAAALQKTQSRKPAKAAVEQYDQVKESPADRSEGAQLHKPRRSRESTTGKKMKAASDYSHSQADWIGDRFVDQKFSQQGNIIMQQRYEGQPQQTPMQQQKAEQPSSGKNYPP